MSRILLVEDEAPVRQSLAMALEDEGYEVVEAASAEEGLAAFGRHDVSLLITDFNLPGETGGWLVAEARRLGLYERPALMVTAAMRVPTLPAVDVLTKPVDLDVFISRVRAQAAPVRAPLPSRGCPLELVLYVARNAASTRALQSVNRHLRDAPPGCSLRLVRLGEAHPGAEAEAERDRVTFAPTLVIKAPHTRAWSVGDVAIDRNLDAWLEFARCGGVIGAGAASAD